MGGGWGATSTFFSTKKRVTRCGHTLELVFNNLSLISEFLVQERGGGEATFFTSELSVETES